MIIGSNKVIWKATGVQPSELLLIFQKKMVGSTTGPVHLDVDVLCLYHRGRAKLDYQGSLQFVVMRLLTLAIHGFHVTGILDGDYRPDCKRSSWYRLMETEFAILNAAFSRNKALSLAARLSEEDVTPEEHQLVKEALGKVRKEISINANKSGRKRVPPSFKEDLEEMIFNVLQNTTDPVAGQLNEKVLKAKFQADSLMAYRVHSGESNGVVTMDTDAAVLLGPDHFYIRSIDLHGAGKKKRKKGVALVTCEIAGGSVAKFDELKKSLTRPGIKWEQVKYPVFDHNDVVLRALVSIALGCDVWKGVKNLGPKKINDFLNKLPQDYTTEEIQEAFTGLMIRSVSTWRFDITDSTRTPFTAEVAKTLVSAILDEAVVYDTSGDDEELDDTSLCQYFYMFEKPTTLTKYVSYFKKDEDNEIEIVDGPPTATCDGVPGITEPHTYLTAEGSFKCFVCAKVFCQACGYVPDLVSGIAKTKSYYREKPHNLCFECFKCSSVAPGMEVNELDPDAVALMKKSLKQMNVQSLEDATPSEIEDMYEHYLNDIPLYESLSHGTEFPVFTTAFFNDIKEHVFYHGPLFSESGFLHDTRSIPDELVPHIIELMASIIRHEAEGTSRYSAAVPKIIIEFSNRSRYGNGTAHKMIRSAMRHAIDPRMKSIADNSFSLFRHQCTHGHSVGLIVEADVPASMKQTQYTTKTAFTMHNLLACGCTCFSSGLGTEPMQGGDRVTCIHNLPPVVLLGLMLHSGYAVNFLHDVAARWTSDIDTRMRLDDMELYVRAKDSLVDIMRVTNVDELTIEKARVNLSVVDMLHNFQCTTDRVQVRKHSAPKKHELIPFRCLPVESVMGRFKRMKVVEEAEASEKECKDDSKKTASSSKKTEDETMNTQNKNKSKSGGVQNDSIDSAKTVGTNTKGPTPPDEPTIPRKGETHINDMFDKMGESDSDSYQEEYTYDYSSDSDDEGIVGSGSSGNPSGSGSGGNPSGSGSGGDSSGSGSSGDSSGSDNPQDNENNGQDNAQIPVSRVLLQAYHLTPEDLAMIHNVRRSQLPSNVGLSSYTSLVGPETLGRGNGNRHLGLGTNLWLNDEVINDYCCGILTEKDAVQNPTSRSYFFNSQFYFWLNDSRRGYDYEGVRSWARRFPEENIFERMEKLIVPINLNNQHWALITVYLQEHDGQGKGLTYMDGLGTSGMDKL